MTAMRSSGTKTAAAKPPRMSDAAVQAKTGKTWKEWFAILDKAGARKMTHQEIAKLLNAEHAVGPWWCQMVTVTYEQQRGLRDKHQRPDGYQISVSRTMAASLPAAYKAFANEKSRARWLPESGLVVRKATPNKTMRVTWKDQESSLEIYFYAKGEEKTQVVVSHTKLRDDKTAAKMKTYWSKALDKLQSVIE
jgi:uncharacterized protein YndB with AHSA1/START domain